MPFAKKITFRTEHCLLYDFTITMAKRQYACHFVVTITFPFAKYAHSLVRYVADHLSILAYSSWRTTQSACKIFDIHPSKSTSINHNLSAAIMLAALYYSRSYVLSKSIAEPSTNTLLLYSCMWKCAVAIGSITYKHCLGISAAAYIIVASRLEQS